MFNKLNDAKKELYEIILSELDSPENWELRTDRIKHKNANFTISFAYGFLFLDYPQNEISFGVLKKFKIRHKAKRAYKALEEKYIKKISEDMKR